MASTTIPAAAGKDGAGAGLRAFLKQARAALLRAHSEEEDTPSPPQQQTIKVVIGNEAADADSIVSAVCLAYFLQHTAAAAASDGSTQYVPVLSLPRGEMKLRPETLLLLRLAGAAEEASDPHFVFLDEADLPALAQKLKQKQERPPPPQRLLQVVLTDHNRLCASLHSLEPCVEAIVDHHEDQGRYPWVQGPQRDVAFEGGLGGTGGSLLSASSSMASMASLAHGGLDGSMGGSSSMSVVGRALVASTCTLVAERVREVF